MLSLSAYKTFRTPSKAKVEYAQPYRKAKSEGKLRPDTKHTEKKGGLQFQTILNKILTIQNYTKLLKYCENFFQTTPSINNEGKRKSILKATPKSNRFKNFQLGQLLIVNGLFVKHLASLSPNPLMICQKYSKNIKQNRKAFLKYFESLAENVQDEKGEEYKELIVREKRKNQKPAIKRPSNQWDQNHKQENQCQVYLEYIQTHPKSFAYYEQELAKSAGKKSANKLKRSSLRIQENEKRIFEKATQATISQLALVEQEIIKAYFPKINQLINYDEELMEVMQENKVLGTYKCYEIVKGGITYENRLNEVSQKQVYPCIWVRNRKDKDRSEYCELDEYVYAYLKDYRL